MVPRKGSNIVKRKAFIFSFQLKNLMKQSNLFAIILVLIVHCNAINAQQNWSPEHVYYGIGGGLTYTPDEQGNIIPDFSHVGYRYGDEEIPTIPVKAEVNPVEGDAGTAIQEAINLVANMEPDSSGFRGAVLLKAGTYKVAGQIIINTSGIVLRGEGNTDEGTIIIAEGTDKRELIKVDNGLSRADFPQTAVAINESYVPVGRKFVVVNNADSFSDGEKIVIQRPGTQKWISDIKMDQITPSEGTVQWSPSSYSFSFERTITKINGDTLFFRNPIVMAMESQYGGGSVVKCSFNRLENVGIEDLCLKSDYTSETDENHSWYAIKISSAENSWVRNVTSWYFAYSCVSLERKSRLITVDNCHCREPKSIITGGRRYSFNLAGSLNLFKNCTTTEGRHDFVTSSRVCGPNVFTNCTATNTHADIGPHHRWAMGTLFDVITTDGAINVQDRDDMGTGHGWAGANQVFWNCKGESSVCQSPWASAKNYNFGFQGRKENGARAGRPDGVWVGHNKSGIFPLSLYKAQLEDRLNNTTLFSVLPKLLQVNKSTYEMSFSFPLDSSTVIKSNFTVEGTAGLSSEKLLSIANKDEYTVVFEFDSVGILPAFSTIVVKALTVKAKNGRSLDGLKEAVYTEPDKRPVVSGLPLSINNIDGVAQASSSKPGFVYIISNNQYPKTQAELDSLVELNLGRKTEAAEADSFVTINATGLPGGYYKYYAVDKEGRVSETISKWVWVSETGPVTGLISEMAKSSFKAYQLDDLIMIDPGDNEEYSLEIYSITGRSLYNEKQLSGVYRVSDLGYTGILLIRKIQPTQMQTKKMYFH